MLSNEYDLFSSGFLLITSAFLKKKRNKKILNKRECFRKFRRISYMLTFHFSSLNYKKELVTRLS